jgi:hypothetical protein
MIAEELKLVITTEADRAIKELKQFQGEVKGATKETAGLTGGLKDLVGGLLQGVLSFEALRRVVKLALNEFYDFEKTQTKLRGVLHATGGSVGYTTDQLNAMSSALSEVTGIHDDLITNAQAVMLTFREVGREIFPQAIEAAANMSAVLGQDLQSSIIQVGKALQEPITGITALRRVGVQLSDQQEAQIKKFMANNDIMGAQKVILKELSLEFGGVAAAMGDTAYGGVQKLKNSFLELMTVQGQYLAETAKPLISFFADLIGKMAAAEKGQAALKQAMTALASGGNIGSVAGAIAEIQELYRAAGSNVAAARMINDQYGTTLATLLRIQASEQWAAEMRAKSAAIVKDTAAQEMKLAEAIKQGKKDYEESLKLTAAQSESGPAAQQLDALMALGKAFV